MDKKANENLFSEIAASSDDDANLVLARGKASFAILNRFPYNSGHTLVLPYRAVPDLASLSTDEALDLWSLVNRVTAALRKAWNPGGFNIGINLGAAAGAGIPGHLHVHVVPRWEHDANFMTATAGTRIHPNDLPSVHKTLKALLEEVTYQASRKEN